MSLSGVTSLRAADPNSMISVITLPSWEVSVSVVIWAIVWRKRSRDTYWLATSLRTASLMASLLLMYSPSETSLSMISTSFWSSFVGIARLMKCHH